MESITFRVVGSQPLLMNNPQTVDPTAPVTKAIKAVTSKRKKSDADTEELMRLKYAAALYMGPEGPYAPSTWLWKAGLEAARKSKQGKDWEQAGVLFTERKLPLLYEGPRTTQDLYANRDFVNVCDGKIGMSRVIAIRPIFEEWALEATIEFDEEIINPETVLAVMVLAGKRFGVGTWRQMYGRFTVEMVSASVNLADACKRLDVPVVKPRRAAA